jgi:hypothetical protein
LSHSAPTNPAGTVYEHQERNSSSHQPILKKTRWFFAISEDVTRNGKHSGCQPLKLGRETMARYPFDEPDEKTVVFHLVEKHRRTMGMSKGQLVKRIGYANVNKGLRNYEEFIDGNYDQPFIVENICTVLVIDPKKLDRTIAKAKRNHAIEKLVETMDDAQEWANDFEEHGIIETELNRPSPIVAAALFRFERLKFVKLDTSRFARSYVQQVLTEIPNRIDASGKIPSFGAPTGTVINMGPEMAIRYDLYGKEVEHLNWAVRIGHAALRV